MKDKVLKTIQKEHMLERGDSVAIALSGGKDSVALFHLLAEMRQNFSLTLSAVHIHHGIRGEQADEDEAFVSRLCEKEGVPLRVFHFDIPRLSKERGMSEEACGRAVRYEVFESLPETRIATAHTLSDSVETILFNLARGSGVKGLLGIPPVRGRMIRPLIECSSDDVLNYLKQNRYSFCTDSTNFNNDYSRNRIRNQVVPELKKVNEAFEKNALQAATILKEQQAFLHTCAHEHIRQYGSQAEALLQAESAVRHEVIRILCEENTGVVPEYRHMERIEAALRTGAKTQINAGAVLRVRAGKLEFPAQPLKEAYSFCIMPGSYSLPIGTLHAEILNCEQFKNLKAKRFSFALDYDKMNAELICRNRQPGDRFFDRRRGLHKSMKKYLNEIAFPPEKRDAFPVFVCGGEIIGTLGSHPSNVYAPEEKTTKILYLYVN